MRKHISEEHKRRISDTNKKRWSNPENRKKQSENMKEVWKNPDQRKNRSNKIKKTCTILEYRKRQSEKTKEAWSNSVSGLNSFKRNRKISIAHKKLRADPNSVYNSLSYRKKLSEAISCNKPILLNELVKCFFCGELIKYSGKQGKCLCVHHIDGEHNNDVPENRANAHIKCHNSYYTDKRRIMMGKKTKRYFESLSSDEHTSLSENRRMLALKQWQNLSPERYKEICQIMSLGKRGGQIR